MKRTRYLLLVALTIVAGLVGGAVSNWVFMARIVVAQNTKHEKVITAEEFRLVNKEGKVFGKLWMGDMRISEGDSNAPQLLFYDGNGGKIVGLAAFPFGGGYLCFNTKQGKQPIITLAAGVVDSAGANPNPSMLCFHYVDDATKGAPSAPAIYICNDLNQYPSLEVLGRDGKVMWEAP